MNKPFVTSIHRIANRQILTKLSQTTRCTSQPNGFTSRYIHHQYKRGKSLVEKKLDCLHFSSFYVIYHWSEEEENSH